MSDLVTGITTAVDVVGKLRALNKKVSEAEFKMLLADLSNALGDAKLAAADLKTELAASREKVAMLEAALAKQSSEEPELDQGAYVFGDKSRHYCTGCYDSRGRKSLLTEMRPPFTIAGKWLCPVCNQHLG